MKWWEVLEVDKNASEVEVKKAYRKKVKEYHPDLDDREASANEMKKINTAYEAYKRKDDPQYHQNPNYKDFYDEKDSERYESYTSEFKTEAGYSFRAANPDFAEIYGAVAEIYKKYGSRKDNVEEDIASINKTFSIPFMNKWSEIEDALETARGEYPNAYIDDIENFIRKCRVNKRAEVDAEHKRIQETKKKLENGYWTLDEHFYFTKGNPKFFSIYEFVTKRLRENSGYNEGDINKLMWVIAKNETEELLFNEETKTISRIEILNQIVSISREKNKDFAMPR